jgi:hypothetical protein
MLAAVVAVVATLGLAAPASAITYGVPDGNGHPEVGALLAPEAYSDGTWETCSGTLISPTVFLTAAHCDRGVSRVAVTFDSAYDPATGTTHWGTWHANPNYNQAQSDPQDVAVVVFDKAVKGITPARLPRAGSLSGLSVGTRFTAVGYGAQSVTIEKGPTFHYADVRYVATGALEALNPSWLRLSMNPARGDGGTCYGDSGGPNSSEPDPARPISWPARRSRETSCAGRPTSTTGWTHCPRGRSSGSTSRSRSRPREHRSLDGYRHRSR